MNSGLIYSLIGGNYFVIDSDNKVYKCRARGKFRNDNISPLVGDFVNFEITENNEGYIQEVLSRKNELYRPKVANVDYGLIVASVCNPSLSLFLLDKMICLLELYNIKPILLFTKTKDFDMEHLKIIIEYYKKIGYKVFTSPTENEIEAEIIDVLNDSTTIVLGQTGAGKSTFINNLDQSLNIKTNEISKALGRGKHTTRHTQIYFIDKIRIVDSPGFSSLEFKNTTTPIEISKCFVEFNSLSQNCKFNTCIHMNEPNCKIKQSLGDNAIFESRYKNYVKIINDLKGGI